MLLKRRFFQPLAAGVLMALLALPGVRAASAQDDDFFRLDPIRPPAMDQPGFRPHAPGAFGGGSCPCHPGYGPQIPGLLEFREVLPRPEKGPAVFEIVARPLVTGPAQLGLMGPADFMLETGERARFLTMSPGDPVRYERAFADLSSGEPKTLVARLTVFDKMGQPALVTEKALAFNLPEPDLSERMLPVFFEQPDGSEIVQYMRPEQAEIYRGTLGVRIGEPPAPKPAPAEGSAPAAAAEAPPETLPEAAPAAEKSPGASLAPNAEGQAPEPVIE